MLRLTRHEAFDGSMMTHDAYNEFCWHVQSVAYSSLTSSTVFNINLPFTSDISRGINVGFDVC